MWLCKNIFVCENVFVPILLLVDGPCAVKEGRRRIECCLGRESERELLPLLVLVLLL